MKVIGWVGIFHVLIIIAWMAFHIVFSILNPITIDDGKAMNELAMTYYSNYPGYLGFDHGSKALVMLISILLPIGLFMQLKEIKSLELPNVIGLIVGCLGFFLYSVSLMLQAVTVEYAFNLYRSEVGDVAQSFALYLYDWAMLEGGLSVSLYIIANLLLASWVLIHSIALYKLDIHKKTSIFGIIVSNLQLIGYFVSWFFLMQANQNMHDFNEAIGLLFMVWIFIISMKMVRGKISIK